MGQTQYGRSSHTQPLMIAGQSHGWVCLVLLSKRPSLERSARDKKNGGGTTADVILPLLRPSPPVTGCKMPRSISSSSILH